MPVDMRPEWMDRLVIQQKPCKNCLYADTKRGSVLEHLKAYGITQVTDLHGEPKPGENTLAREFGWGDIVKRLDEIALCRIPEKSGAVLVHVAATCPHWTEDHGRIWLPVTKP